MAGLWGRRLVGCANADPQRVSGERKPGMRCCRSSRVQSPGPELSAARVIFFHSPLLSHSRRKSLPAVEARTLLVMIPLEWL